MSSVPSLAFAKPSDDLPTCSAHLMPFHISHSGRAPIKSYFMIKPASSLVGQGPKDIAAELAKAEVESAVERTAMETKDNDGMDVDCTPEVEAAPTASSSLSTMASSSSSVTLVGQGSLGGQEQERYVAAFRGRSIHGLKVALPEGYTGLVLRTPDKGKAEEGNPAPASSKPRSTRRGRNAARADDAEEDTTSPYFDQQLNKRMLTPTHTFRSLTLWHPDIPVDEGKDEYWRSLKEWVTLSHEIHKQD